MSRTADIGTEQTRIASTGPAGRNSGEKIKAMICGATKTPPTANGSATAITWADDVW